MPFDIDSARSSGYSDSDITSYLAPKVPNFDIDSARKAGHTDTEISTYLAQKVGQEKAAPTKETSSTENNDSVDWNSVHAFTGGAHAALSNLGNLESSLYAKATGTEKDYEQSQARADTQNLNVQQSQNIKKANEQPHGHIANLPFLGSVGKGDVANFLGESTAVAPVAAVTGGAAGVAGEGLTASTLGKGIVSRYAGAAAGGAGAGAAYGASAPTNAPTVDESLGQALDNVKQGAKQGALFGAGGKLAGDMYKLGKGAALNRTISGAQVNAAKEQLNITTPQEQQAVLDYKATPNDKREADLTVSEITKNAAAAAQQRQVEHSTFISNGKNVNPAIDLMQKREGNETALSNEINSLNVQNAKPEALHQQAETAVNQAKATIPQATSPAQPARAELPPEIENAPTKLSEQTNLGGVARDVLNSGRNEIKQSYNNIAPDDSITGPTTKIQTDFSKIHEEGNNSLLIHGDQEADTPTTKRDAMLSEISKRYDSDNVPIRQQIQDKNNLQDYIGDRYDDLRGVTLGTEPQSVIKQKIQIAKDMRDSIKNNLSTMDDVPSSLKDETGNIQPVSKAFTNAEAKYKEFSQNYLENHEQYVENTEGQDYNHSLSKMGEYNRRLMKQTADGLATEAGKIAPWENPKELIDSLHNVKNLPAANSLTSSSIVSHIANDIKTAKDPVAAFDKGYTPELREALLKNNLNGAHTDLMNLRDALVDAKGRADATNTSSEATKTAVTMTQAKLQSDLEKTIAHKLTTGKINVDDIANSPEYQAQALELVKKSNDPASIRGLGKLVLDKIRQQASDTTTHSDFNTISSIDSEKLEALLAKNKDILQQTIPKEFEAIQKTNELLKLSQNYVHKYSVPNGTVPNAADLTKAAQKGIAIEAGVHGGLPPSVTSNILNALKGLTSEQYKAAQFKLTDPDIAPMLWQKAQNSMAVDKFISQVTNSKVLGAVGAGMKVKGNSKQQLNDQVKKVMSPSTKAEHDDDEESSWSNLFIPSAGAAGLNSKRGSPVSSGGDKDSPISKKKDDQLAYIKSRQSIQNAAKTGNVTGEYLQGLEHMESGTSKDPSHARPLDKHGDPMSSAKGVGQWLVGSWEDIRKHHPDLPPITAKNDPRTNDDIARKANAYEAADNYKRLIKDKVLPWEPTAADVYGTHVMGYEGFKKFYAAGNKNKNGNPADVVPQAVKNNPAIFTHNGRPATYNEAYRNLMKTFQYGHQEASN